MSGLELLFLGIMAAALVAMALAQMMVARESARVARQAIEATQEFRRDLRPILDRVQKITDDVARVSADLSRMSALAVVQTERLDAAMSSTLQRVDETVSVVQDAIVRPIRTGAAIVAGIQAALSFFARGEAGRRSRDDEDALFIG